ncbi:hypothetical protein EV182_003030 [Spiromyces aspiralis]|uniref:Uncharacterized protein n=1 Tax=Spiromyces aspiralis TaxID=68401 RepID=A0ACC1HT58_9FUNG|nr:hypothetical protein EV182_003030 [Spiromyces aspiralis]
MVGYGMAKAAVHHLVRITIDTPANRSGMPDADFSAWTPPDHLCGKIYSWASEGLPFPNGGLVKFVTKDGNTEFVADLGDN